jgi:hypothetical protein
MKFHWWVLVSFGHKVIVMSTKVRWEACFRFVQMCKYDVQELLKHLLNQSRSTESLICNVCVFFLLLCPHTTFIISTFGWLSCYHADIFNNDILFFFYFHNNIIHSVCKSLHMVNIHVKRWQAGLFSVTVHCIEEIWWGNSVT